MWCKSAHIVHYDTRMHTRIHTYAYMHCDLNQDMLLDASRLFCGRSTYPKVRVVCTGVNTHTHALSHKDTYLRTWNVFSAFLSVRLCVSLCFCVCVFLSLSLSLFDADRTMFFTKYDQKCPPQLVSSPGLCLVHFI